MQKAYHVELRPKNQYKQPDTIKSKTELSSGHEGTPGRKMDKAVLFSLRKQASVYPSSFKTTIEYSSTITCMELLVHIDTDRKIC